MPDFTKSWLQKHSDINQVDASCICSGVHGLLLLVAFTVAHGCIKKHLFTFDNMLMLKVVFKYIEISGLCLNVYKLGSDPMFS